MTGVFAKGSRSDAVFVSKLSAGSRVVRKATARAGGVSSVVWPFQPVVWAFFTPETLQRPIPLGAKYAWVIASGGGAGGGESGSEDGRAGSAGRLVARKVTLPSNTRKLKVNVGRGGAVAGYGVMTQLAKGAETVVDFLDPFGYELPSARVYAGGGVDFASYETRDAQRDLAATTAPVLYRKMIMPRQWDFLLYNRTVQGSLYVETIGGGSRELWQGPDPRSRVSLDGKYGSGGYGGNASSLMGGRGGDGFAVIGFTKE